MTEVIDYRECDFHKQLVRFHEGDMDLVAADVALALKNLDIGDESIDTYSGLNNLFVWSSTEQGHNYWAERCGWKPRD